MRLIDADALLKKRRNFGKEYSLDPVDKNVDDQLIDLRHVLKAPTLDYAPVVHGEWIHDINNLYACSECLMRQTQRMRGHLMNYCPNCGANMMPLPEPPKEE